MIEVNLVLIVLILALLLIAFLLIFAIYSGFNVRLFIQKDEKNIDKDKSIAEKLIDKFPLVSPEFINKPSKEQIIENNQEIHEINKKLEQLAQEFEQWKKN